MEIKIQNEANSKLCKSYDCTLISIEGSRGLRASHGVYNNSFRLLEKRFMVHGRTDNQSQGFDSHRQEAKLLRALFASLEAFLISREHIVIQPELSAR